MQDKFLTLDHDLYDYVVAHGVRPDPVLADVAAETEELGGVAVMQTASEEAALLTLLARAIGAQRAIEVGTFTGYGSISIARGLPEEGLLVTCEISPEYAAMAQRHIDAAGMTRRVDLRVGPALDTLRSLRSDAPFDFAFLDADKQGYPDYYEALLTVLRPGGLIVIDNVLQGGRVLDPAEDDRSAQVMRALNDRIITDERVDATMLAVADGITIVRKR